MSKKTMAAAPMEETPVVAAAPAADPAPAPLPPTGGCWVRHPDGRLERVNEDGTPWVDPAAAAAEAPAEAPAEEPNPAPGA